MSNAMLYYRASDGTFGKFKQKELYKSTRNSYKISAWKSEGMRSLWRPKHMWEDIEMHLKETGCEGVDWIHVAQDKVQSRILMNVVMSLQVP
jgi:hypothetical protein